MADIRCLVCNRLNDASAQRCWYCQAPLQPGHAEVPRQAEKPDNENLVPQEDDTTREDKLAENIEESIEEVPEWLARVRRLKAQERKVAQQSTEQPLDEGEIPLWLENLRNAHPDEISPGTTQEALIDETLDLDNPPVQDLPGVAGARDLPDESPANGETMGIEAAQGQPSEPGESQPASGKDKQEPDHKYAEKPFLPINLEDLPDWLDSQSDLLEKIADHEQDNDGEESAPQDEKLEKAVMPAWLKSMQPLDMAAAIPDPESPSGLGEEGILAGISGTLRSLQLEDREISKPATPQEIEARAAQQKNAAMLYSMLHPESIEMTPALREKDRSGRNKVLRALVILILLFFVIFPFASKAFPVVVPVLYPKEVVDVLTFIDQAPAEKPVLVAAHFEAGLAGELGWTMEPVFQHLVSRGIPLVLVSTNVSGYAVLEQQVRQVAAAAPGYLFEEKVVNLGYLPGGTIGLISLVNNVRDTLPFSTSLEPAWESTAVEKIYTFSDFGSVVVITDNPEIVRAWVEQSGRTSVPPPLIALVSAQAAPLVKPYYVSGQVRGYLSGASGALSYELIRQVPGRASRNYSSYQLALLAAAGLVFLGGIVSLITSPGVPTKKKGGG